MVYSAQSMPSIARLAGGAVADRLDQITSWVAANQELDQIARCAGLVHAVRAKSALSAAEARHEGALADTTAMEQQLSAAAGREAEARREADQMGVELEQLGAKMLLERSRASATERWAAELEAELDIVSGDIERQRHRSLDTANKLVAHFDLGAHYTTMSRTVNLWCRRALAGRAAGREAAAAHKVEQLERQLAERTAQLELALADAAMREREEAGREQRLRNLEHEWSAVSEERRGNEMKLQKAYEEQKNATIQLENKGKAARLEAAAKAKRAAVMRVRLVLVNMLQGEVGAALHQWRLGLSDANWGGEVEGASARLQSALGENKALEESCATLQRQTKEGELLVAEKEMAILKLQASSDGQKTLIEQLQKQLVAVAQEKGVNEDRLMKACEELRLRLQSDVKLAAVTQARLLLKSVLWRGIRLALHQWHIHYALALALEFQQELGLAVMTQHGNVCKIRALQLQEAKSPTSDVTT